MFQSLSGLSLGLNPAGVLLKLRTGLCVSIPFRAVTGFEPAGVCKPAEQYEEDVSIPFRAVTGFEPGHHGRRCRNAGMGFQSLSGLSLGLNVHLVCPDVFMG